MRKKGLVIVGLVCLLLAVFVAQGFCGKAWQKPRKRSVHQQIPDDAPTARPPSQDIPFSIRYPGKVVTQDIICEDIDPDVGTIIQHDQIGHTWYDFQQNGTMGRMISVTSDGFRHFSWMFTDGPYSGEVYRYVDANCKDPFNEYVGQVHVYGGFAKNAGYSNQAHLNDGTSVVVYHRTAGQAGDPIAHTMISIEDSLCSGEFGRFWDLPDSLFGTMFGENGLWPRVATRYDAVAEKDYIHVILLEAATVG